MQDPETGAKPALPDTPINERRVIGRALKCWDSLRTAGMLPDAKACVTAFDRTMREAVVVIRVARRMENDMIETCGEALCDAIGGDPVGMCARDILPCSTERGLVFWRVAAEMRKPIADIGRFTNRAGVEVHYRALYVPTSDHTGRVNRLIGIFSYKTVH